MEPSYLTARVKVFLPPTQIFDLSENAGLQSEIVTIQACRQTFVHTTHFAVFISCIYFLLYISLTFKIVIFILSAQKSNALAKSFKLLLKILIKKSERIYMQIKYAEKLIFVTIIYNIILIAFHLSFWKICHWGSELPKLMAINGAIMQTSNLCLTFIFIIMTYIALSYRKELLNTSIGIAILYSFSIFWLLRLIEQFVFFDMTKIVNIILAIYFILGILIYLIPALIMRQTTNAE